MRIYYKIREIESQYDSPFNVWIKDQYVNKEMSTNEITEKIEKDTGIIISPRHIQRKVKSLGLTRDQSTSFQLAIAKGRKTYDHLRKPFSSRDLRKGISLEQRYSIFKRDNGRCALCGVAAKHKALVIDHIIPVVNGGTNDPSNLRTLCRECNHGKRLHEQEK